MMQRMQKTSTSGDKCLLMLLLLGRCVKKNSLLSQLLRQRSRQTLSLLCSRTRRQVICLKQNLRRRLRRRRACSVWHGTA